MARSNFRYHSRTLIEGRIVDENVALSALGSSSETAASLPTHLTMFCFLLRRQDPSQTHRYRHTCTNLIEFSRDTNQWPRSIEPTQYWCWLRSFISLSSLHGLMRKPHTTACSSSITDRLFLNTAPVEFSCLHASNQRHMRVD